MGGSASGPDGPVFLPSNEPYLGRRSVHQFDQMVVWALENSAKVANCTWTGETTPLQTAACQIVPQGINLALTIRELVRQDYLFGAAVLLRPLMERAGIISYLAAHPDAIPVWENGWQHGKRPSLPQMLESMSKGSIDRKRARELCNTLNHLVHGDPYSAAHDLVQVGEATWGYAVGKTLDDADFCDFVCFTAYSWLIVLVARALECFPEAAAAGPPEGPPRPPVPGDPDMGRDRSR